MTTFIKFRKSRKDRICDDASWAHDRHIKVGDVYANISVSPNDVRGEWFYQALCEDCGREVVAE